MSVPALASHPEVSLTGSNFEIDTDANLVQNDASPSLDWKTSSVVSDTVLVTDSGTGSTDNAFTGGAKEDTGSPKVTFGSIPPNKSDLKAFGLYSEDTGSEHFLHLFWTRVQDPSGTTNMDFEFNQEHCTPSDPSDNGDVCAANGTTPVRTDGDLLLTYDLARGGTHPILSLRTWDGTNKKWGAPADLSTAGSATGSINSSAITAANSLPSLGGLSARTFGEASVDLDLIFDPTTCHSFGFSYVKSRSSDSFTSELKDFIVPSESVGISNCGRVVVNKVDAADGTTLLAGATFSVSPANQDGTTALTEVADGVFCIDNLLIGTAYTVTEDSPPAGYDPPTPDNQSFTPSTTGTCDVVDSSTSPDLTFSDTAQTGNLVIEKHDESGTLLSGAAFTFTNDGDNTDTGSFTESATAGRFCAEGLVMGATYTVSETTAPDGYTAAADQSGSPVAGDCADRLDSNGDFIDATTPDAADLTFVDMRITGNIVVEKVDDAGNLLSGAAFSWTNDADNTNTGSFTESATAGRFCADGLDLSATYTVSETTTPTDYAGADDVAGVSPVTGSCADRLDGTTGDFTDNTDAADVTMSNEQLHKVIVIVCHQKDATLAPSDVYEGSNTSPSFTSAGSGDLGTLDEGDLCGLPGVGDKEHGNQALTVDVGSDAH
jgi:hypothetical protein